MFLTDPRDKIMRKNPIDSGFSVRLRVSEALGREIHLMSLKENRSQSSAISILVSEALAARRSAASQVAEVSRLVATIKGEATDFAP
jgi:hypothetical protein